MLFLGGGGFPAPFFAKGALPLNIADLFSTDLYTGNGSTQTITNGIDLAGEGGLVWIKRRSTAIEHVWHDTERGFGARGYLKTLQSNETFSEDSNPSDGIDQVNSDGFRINTSNGSWNFSGETYVSWTFRRAPRFFDVVTYTGDGTSGRTIPHNLGVAPGMIIIKGLNSLSNWAVWHRSNADGYRIFLNLDLAAVNSNETTWFASTNIEQTDSVFKLGSSGASQNLNNSGDTYVAYLFAHDTAPDSVIQCGSYTGNGSATGPVINLGWEPQWVLVKQSSASGQWWNIIDAMRGFDVLNGAQTLGANASDAEYTNANFGSNTPILSPVSTGFQARSNQPATNASGENYIYVAIRKEGS